LPERREGECVERLLEVVQLPCDEGEAFLPLRRAIEPFELVGDPVETLEECVELAVSNVVLVHECGF
jgi:hypothetical protein